MLYILSDHLSELAFSYLKSDLDSFGVIPSRKEIEAFRAILTAFSGGISNSLSPSFFLSSLPAGSGKTQAIAAFIRAWKANGFLPAGGILIAFKTLEEIESLILRLGLERSDIGCFTKDDRVNGLGRDDANSAPVLLTTQQMLASRTSDRSFAAASDFHYNGNARSLRIWDESFRLSEPVAITLYALQALPARLHVQFGSLVDDLNLLADQLRNAPFGALISVPRELKPRLNAVSLAVEEKRLHLHASDQRTIDTLGLCAGRELIVCKAGGKGSRALVGSSRPLPDDLAPLVITDASGEVSTTYDIMHQARGNLVRLPSATSDYRDVQIHLWETSIGKGALRDEKKSWSIYNRVAKQMRETRGEWLIVSYKATDRLEGALDIEAALREAVDGLAGIAYLNWGRHHGTNAYKHVKNVVVIGSHFYPSESYDAIAIAASGLLAGEVPVPDRRTVKAGEFKHNMLQAVLRGNARNGVNGIAGECNVYIIASPNSHAGKLLQEAFPGAMLHDWGLPKERRPSKHAEPLIAALEQLLLPASKVRKKDIVEAAGMRGDELRRTLDDRAVRRYLTAKAITVDRHWFARDKSSSTVALPTSFKCEAPRCEA